MSTAAAMLHTHSCNGTRATKSLNVLNRQAAETKKIYPESPLPKAYYLKLVRYSAHDYEADYNAAYQSTPSLNYDTHLNFICQTAFHRLEIYYEPTTKYYF